MTGMRRITDGFNLARTTGTLWNSQPRPDGSWTIADGRYANGSVDVEYLAKVPPYPGPQKGVARNTWIPIAVQIPSVPSGTNNVVVEFGYNPSFYCTPRQEVCVANASAIQAGNAVFSYATSDAYSGLVCSTGCTVTIPSHRDAANAVIATGTTQVTATP